MPNYPTLIPKTTTPTPNSHGTSKGSLGDLELAFDRFRDVLHERLDIKHKLGMLFFATLA